MLLGSSPFWTKARAICFSTVVLPMVLGLTVHTHGLPQLTTSPHAGVVNILTGKI